ncbi:dTDP-4-dehydrorhamnose reductase [Alkalicoccobacillus plakortidis]|uniref:dTDP-4-dehydrorhamnose reductase n=1 Tax=Alkalicoccobacillus plakortidis TaxID=444060 RepID=A0ABT0XIK0_9BACI|nr:dTDP-4-dehydrorhamnose reductase [Alkalicoccobacillus plakortidis]MCM2675042.1 dTDP-4-dehydrorhamnose reductase [Alkalicoccobacillus plakortidis]
MRILITGANGRLAKAFAAHLESEDVFAFSKNQLDCTNREQVMSTIKKINPDLILHCAALTDVEECERQPMKAFSVNCLAVQFIAEAAGTRRLVIFSTDYLFSTYSITPYLETNAPQPDNIYALSKWMAEESVRHFPNLYIIRTSWLFGGQADFVDKIIGKASESTEIKVVCDQVGSPTYIKDLVKWTLTLLNHAPGIYHLTNSGYCSRFEWAQEILSYTKPQVKLLSVETKNLSTGANRPAHTILSTEKWKGITGYRPREWRDALDEYMQELLL